AIIVVHLAGMPAEMDGIMDLAKEHDLWVIEDCAQAHGAKYKGKSVGSIGHVGAWSFCQDKIMTTGGEGGMVTTNDKELWSKMWSYKDHGKSYDAVYH
ncbi:DegT/DnrJ/EryC1/StrS family aminotransferase, partial [Neisseria sp. P0001.S010]